MKIKDIKIGMQVKVNELPDATIYTIVGIDGFQVALNYYEEGAGWFAGGKSDISVLIKHEVHCEECQTFKECLSNSCCCDTNG